MDKQEADVLRNLISSSGITSFDESAIDALKLVADSEYVLDCISPDSL